MHCVYRANTESPRYNTNKGEVVSTNSKAYPDQALTGSQGVMGAAVGLVSKPVSKVYPGDRELVSREILFVGQPQINHKDPFMMVRFLGLVHKTLDS